MEKYNLTPFQKELFLAIAPIIRKTQSLEFIISWLNDGGHARPMFFEEPKIDDRSWRDQWGKMSQSDFRVLENKRYIHFIAGDTYGLDVAAILEAVDTNFGSRSIENPTPHIFISYARANKSITERLFSLLSLAYDSVWYDRKLRTGQEWEQELLNQISLCTDFIFLLSKDSVESSWCKKEFDEAVRLSRHILLFRLDDTDLPDWLKHLQVSSMKEINADTIAELFATFIRTSNRT